MAKKSIEDLGSLSSKRVLIRVDFNVPFDDGRISDDFRIRSSLPSLNKVLAQGGRAILMSHLGRPKGKVVEALSLKPVAEHLATLIDATVRFVPDITGEAAQKAASELKDGEVLVLENLRFDPGEKSNDPAFVKALAALGEVYISDAFGTCHREHASVCGLPGLLPSAAGDLVQAEVENLSPLLNDAPRPYVVVLGGAKLETKIPLLENLLPKVDAIVVGGGMAYTFLKAQGHSVGRSRVDESLLEKALNIMESVRESGREGGAQLYTPVDSILAKGLEDPSGFTIAAQDFPDELMGLDIGPKTLDLYLNLLKDAKTVFWNGPMGVFERPPFHLGTLSLATFLAYRQAETKTIVGGGDSAAAVRQLGLADRMAHVSTGGGASMEFLEGKSLPGLDALPDRD